MQIAPLSVVFALASAGALGMAVKETVTGMQPPATSFEEQAEEYASSTEEDLEHQRQAIEEMEREEAAARAQDERMFAARAPLVPTFFGDDVASMGPAFGVLELGMSVERYSVSQAELAGRFEDAALVFEPRASTQVAALSVLGMHEAHVFCPLVIDTAVARWGSPTVPATELQHIWWNPKTGNRFRVDTTDSCELVFEKAQPLETWWPRMQALAAMKTRDLVERAHTQAVVEASDLKDDFAWWSEPGLAAGDGPTSVYVRYAGDAVTSVDLAVRSDPETIAAVEKKLRQVNGTPSDETPDTMTWARRDIYVKRISSTSLEITYGEPQ